MRKLQSKVSIGSLRRTDLAEKVSRLIRRAIFDGRLKAGDRIRETQLSRELRISRTPLREALRYLEQEGLIQRTPYRGVHVTSYINQDEIRRVFRIRAVLESMAIHDAHARLQPSDQKALRDYIEAMKAAADKNDLSELNRNDMAFHKYIWKLSGDSVLEGLLNNLCQHGFVVYNLQTLPLLNHVELGELLQSHRDYLDVLEKAGPDTLERIQALQEKTLARVWKLFETRKAAES